MAPSPQACLMSMMIIRRAIFLKVWGGGILREVFLFVSDVHKLRFCNFYFFIWATNKRHGCGWIYFCFWFRYCGTQAGVLTDVDKLYFIFVLLTILLWDVAGGLLVNGVVTFLWSSDQMINMRKLHRLMKTNSVRLWQHLCCNEEKVKSLLETFSSCWRCSLSQWILQVYYRD